jgi:hypothetical protein
VVAQIGVRKTLFRKEVGKASAEGETAGKDCSAAKWERHPVRVTFSPGNGQPFSVNVVRRHAEELAQDNESEQ